MSIYKKLLRTAKILGIKVYKKNTKYVSTYYPETNIIKVSNKNTNLAPHLAHELGHCLFEMSGTTQRVQRGHTAYRAMAEKKINGKQRDLIIEEERVAWQVAKILLKKVGYRDWKRFENMKSNGINNYILTIERIMNNGK